jgi:hypothetical protein
VRLGTHLPGGNGVKREHLQTSTPIGDYFSAPGPNFCIADLFCIQIAV